MNVQAQPTQRRKTTRTCLPPNCSCLSRSMGARSPTRGHSVATATDDGGGDSHACAVSGSLRTDIHFGQLLFGSLSSSRSFTLLLEVLDGEEKLKVSLEMPILRMASLVVKLVVRSENIVAAVGVESEGHAS
jgi:hypothetical protein